MTNHRYRSKQKRPTISISPAIHERLKEYAKEQGITVQAVVEACVADIGVKP